MLFYHAGKSLSVYVHCFSSLGLRFMWFGLLKKHSALEKLSFEKSTDNTIK